MSNGEKVVQINAGADTLTDAQAEKLSQAIMAKRAQASAIRNSSAVKDAQTKALSLQAEAKALLDGTRTELNRASTLESEANADAQKLTGWTAAKLKAINESAQFYRNMLGSPTAKAVAGGNGVPQRHGKGCADGTLAMKGGTCQRCDYETANGLPSTRAVA